MPRTVKPAGANTQQIEPVDVASSGGQNELMLVRMSEVDKEFTKTEETLKKVVAAARTKFKVKKTGA